VPNGNGNGSSQIGSLSVSVSNTPQAGDDTFDSFEDLVAYLDVLDNDSGGNSKSLYSLSSDLTVDDGGTVTAAEIIAAGQVLTIETGLGATATIMVSGDNADTIEYNTAALDFLAEGEVVVDTFSYVIQLGNGTYSIAVVSIEVVGTNDTPTVAAALTTGANEDDAAFTLDLLDGASDVDNGAVLSVANVAGLEAGVSVSGSTLTVDPADAAFQALAHGETYDIVVTYDVVDEHGAFVPQSATVTITGTNDTPTVAAALTTGANEDDAAFTLDLLDGASDVDNGAVLSVANVAGLEAGVSVSGSTLTVDPADAAFQALAHGETYDIVVTYDVVDEHGAFVPQSATVTITGTNDLPTVVVDTSSADADVEHSGNVLANDSDTDATDVLSVSAIVSEGGTAGIVGDPLDGSYGTLIMNSNGGWTYQADQSNPDVYGLALGEEISETFTYTASDGNGGDVQSTLTVTIVGINTPPDAADDIAAATEDGAGVSGNVGDNDSDADPGATLTFAQTGDAVAGFNMLSDGSWTFDPADAAYQYLANGETADVEVAYEVTDNNGATDNATLTITVTGTNDTPVGAAVGFEVGEDGPAGSANLLDAWSDADTADVLQVVAVNGGGNIGNTVALSGGGTITVLADGSITFDPNNAYESLAEGESVVENFSYTVFDGTDYVTVNETITVHGVNDDPEAQDDGFEVYQYSVLSGDLTADNGNGEDSDVDASDTLSVTLVNGSPANVGSQIVLASGALLTVNADGTFEYDDNDVFGLAPNESIEDSFTYTIDDGNGGTSTATVVVTVNGALPDPVIIEAGAEDIYLARAANGAAGISAPNYQNYNGTPTNLEGGLGGDGTAGANASAVYANELLEGAANDDSLSIIVDAQGQAGGNAGNGGNGGSDRDYSWSSGSSSSWTSTSYRDTGNGGDAGVAGAGGNAEASAQFNTMAAYAGGDILSISADAQGGQGGDGGNGGNGGFGGHSGRYYYYNRGWWSSWSSTRNYTQTEHGDGGQATDGAAGGFAFSSVDLNDMDGSFADDVITVSAEARGGRGGDGGNGGSSYGAYNTANAGVTQDGANGGAGGDAHASVTNNILNGADGNDVIELSVLAEGGFGGLGGNSNSLSSQHESGANFRDYGERYNYYGDSGDGGNGGDGGSALATVSGNSILGGSGNDSILLSATAIGGDGSNGGTTFAGTTTDFVSGALHYGDRAGVAGADGSAGAAGLGTVVVTNNLLSGGEGNDDITIELQGDSITFDANTLDGGDGADSLTITTSGSYGIAVDFSAGTLVLGGSGSNTLSSIENVSGTASADSFTGGSGDETVTGNGGADHFEFALDGMDEITDFEAGSDTLELTGLGVTFADLDTDGDGILEDGEGNGDITIALTADGLVISNADGSLLLNGETGLAEADLLLT